MKSSIKFWAAGIGIVTTALVVSNIWAATDDVMNAEVNKIADLVEKGDTAGAKKAAKAFAEKKDKDGKDLVDTEDFMAVLRLRTKKGIGMGAKAGDIQPDGIELKIEAMARDGITPAGLKKEGEALVRASNVIAAVAHTAYAKAPAKDVGKQKKADWVTWSEGLAAAAEELKKAVNGNSPADVKAAAGKVKQNCDSCHNVFK